MEGWGAMDIMRELKRLTWGVRVWVEIGRGMGRYG